MKKILLKWRRVLGIVLAVAMVFGYSPLMHAYAEYVDAGETSQTPSADNLSSQPAPKEKVAALQGETLPLNSSPEGENSSLEPTEEEEVPPTESSEDGEETSAPSELPVCTCGSESDVHTEECPLYVPPQTDPVQDFLDAVADLEKFHEDEGDDAEEQMALERAVIDCYDALSDEQKDYLGEEYAEMVETLRNGVNPLELKGTGAEDEPFIIKNGGDLWAAINASNDASAAGSDKTYYFEFTNTVTVNKSSVWFNRNTVLTGEGGLVRGELDEATPLVTVNNKVMLSVEEEVTLDNAGKGAIARLIGSGKIDSEQVTLVASCKRENGENHYFESVQAAIGAAEDGETVRLVDDIAESITIPASKNLTLDLAGHTLTGTTEDGRMTDVITNFGTLAIQDSASGGTVMGGTDAGTDVGRKGIALVNEIGGTCTVLSGKIMRGDEGTFGNYTVQNKGRMYIKGGEIRNNSSNSSLVVNFNKVNDSFNYADNAWMEISGGTLQQDKMAALKNDPGADLHITGDAVIKRLGGDVNSNACIFYGTVVMDSGSIETDGIIPSYTWKEGDKEFPATFAVTGGKLECNEIRSINGASLDTITKNEKPVITIGGSATVKANRLYTLQNNGKNNSGNDLLRIVTNGTTAEIRVSCGTYGRDVSKYAAEGYVAEKQDENTWIVKQLDPVAKIGDTIYYTLQKAVDAVENNGTATIEMVGNSHEPAIIPAGKTIVLNVPAGITLDNASTQGGWANAVLQNYGTLTVVGKGDIRTAKGAGFALKNFEGGTANLNGGVFCSDVNDYVVWNLGTMTIDGATLDNVSTNNTDNTVLYNGWRPGESGGMKGNVDATLTFKSGKILSKVTKNAVLNNSHAHFILDGGEIKAPLPLVNWDFAEIKSGSITVTGQGNRAIYCGGLDRSEESKNGQYRGVLTISGGNFYNETGKEISVISVDSTLPEPTGTVSGGTYYKNDDKVNQYATENSHLIPIEGEDGRWRLGYTVAFMDGERIVDTKNVAKDMIVTATDKTPAERIDSVFAGWDFAFGTPIFQDTTINANWKLKEYTVTFDAAGGSAVPSQTRNYNTRFEAPANPTRPGYIFSGWRVIGATANYDFATPVTGNITLTAQWTAIPTPTPVPDDDDDDDDDPTPTVTLPDPPVPLAPAPTSPTAPVAPSVPSTPVTPVTPPTTSITDPQVPLANVPAAEPNQPLMVPVVEPLMPEISGESWSLVNLLLMLFTALASVWQMLRKSRNRRSLFTLIPAIGALLLFFFTENMRNPMALFNQFTVFMVMIAAIQIVLLVFHAKNDEETIDAA